ncbi:MAG TPA: hypothetical protein VF836_05750 [Gemmatimonadaceae bacterium]
MSVRFARARCVCALASLAALCPRDALAQTSAVAEHSMHSDRAQQVTPHNDPSIDSLLGVARRASEAFSDRSAAISAGYRRVGMDFPSMGEHWVNPSLVLEEKFDVSRPAILTYTVVRGQPLLLGVVYAIPLAPGQAPPTSFGPEAIWHEHNGSVEEESLLPEHHSMPSSASGTRLAILHAWVQAPNPDGVFAAENWALPFLRVGLDVPSGFPKGAARAISLLSGGERYFRELAGQSANAAVTAALGRCADVARAVVTRAQARGQPFGSTDLEEVDGAWSTAVLEVRRAAGSDVARRINGGVLPGERR